MKDIDEAIDSVMDEHMKGLDVVAQIAAETRTETDDAAGELDLRSTVTMIRERGFDDQSAANFRELFNYVAALRRGDAVKGLCLMGTVGTGKTLALKTFFRKPVTARLLVDRYMNLKEWYQEYVYGFMGTVEDIAIDDLGAEPTCNDYGTRIEVLDEVISARAALYVDRKCKTHITTNLTVQEMDDRYGPRLFSRITEICNVVIFDGPDRRNVGNESYMEKQ